MNLKVTPIDEKEEKIVIVTARISFTEKELDDTASYQLTKKDIYEMFKKSEVKQFQS